MRAVVGGAATSSIAGRAAADRAESVSAPDDLESPVDHVNPFIGTDLFFGRDSRGILEVFHRGMTLPGPTRPWGLAQVSPDTYPKGHGSTLAEDPTNKGSKVWPTGSQTGYAYEDSAIEGFSHTHLNGTGCSGYGNVLVMATRGRPGTTEREYRSAFSHDTEEATPGYYAVTLSDYEIDAEVTATERVGVHRYTFSETETAEILFDATHHAQSSPAEGSVTIEPENNAVRGETTVEEDFCGGVRSYTVYFHAEIAKPFTAYGTWDDDQGGTGRTPGSTSESSGDCGAYVEFPTANDETIVIKVGLSYVSQAQAKRNLQAEVPGWDFESVRTSAVSEWDEKLSRIEVEGGTQEQRVIFYTALYNCLRFPHVFSDADGSYVGMDGAVHTAEGYTKYATHDTWGMFRSLHPLLTLVAPDRQRDMLTSMVDYFDTTDWIPRWPLANINTNVMIANHAGTIFTSAYLKGIRDFDIDTAYDAMRKSVTSKPGLQDPYEGKRKLEQYKQFGYVPFQTVAESDLKGKINYETPGNVIHNFNSQTTNDHSVSMTLEYAYNDWVLAELATILGHDEDRDRFLDRSFNYRNIFDTKNTGWMRPKLVTGTWHRPWEPSDEDGFTEGNAWHYSWFVPHDMGSVIEGMGGPQTVIDRLDNFSEGVEESGLSGTDYWHGNQPNKGPYLYNYVGQPWETQRFVRHVQEKVHGPGPGGLMGNEDLGATSAWYVLSAMGFYPTNPASAHYEIGSPIFEKVTIHLDDDYYEGDTFVIEAPEASPENKYVQSANLNGVQLEKPWFSHFELLGGGHLKFEMGANPNREWGSDVDDAPPLRPAIPELLVVPGESDPDPGEVIHIIARLTDESGTPIADQEVRWYTRDGAVTPERTTTGSDGTVVVEYTADRTGSSDENGGSVTAWFAGSPEYHGINSDVEFGDRRSTDPFTVTGTRTDDADVFTGGQTNRVTVTVDPSQKANVRDTIPDEWGIHADAGDVARVVHEASAGVKYVYLTPPASAEGISEYTYFAEAPSETGSSGVYEMGPVEASPIDSPAWVTASGTSDRNVAVETRTDT
jgi:predicted alpha-1,2-mannosidase